ncbi:pre-16S rRNA-processing nuclease YqgF [bacterium]|nr:pre-16S rRNA-processing nuclease YqgF [bacterium]
MKFIIALDPGSDKCGFAVIPFDPTHEGKPSFTGEKGVVFLSELHRTLKRLCSLQLPEAIVIGSGTASNLVKDIINDIDLKLEVRFSDEKNTTLEARKRYFEENPPKGFWRLVPLGLQTPPTPIDDYAAQLIGERYLRSIKGERK